MEIKVLTTGGIHSSMTVASKEICDGAFVIAQLSCIDTGSKIKIYDDEIDNLIAALTEIKKELR